MVEIPRIVGSALLLILLPTGGDAAGLDRIEGAAVVDQEGTAATGQAPAGDSLRPDSAPTTAPGGAPAEAAASVPSPGESGSAPSGEATDDAVTPPPRSSIKIPLGPLGDLELGNIPDELAYGVLLVFGLGLAAYLVTAARRARAAPAVQPRPLRRLAEPALGFAAGFGLALLVISAFGERSVAVATGEQIPAPTGQEAVVAVPAGTGISPSGPQAPSGAPASSYAAPSLPGAGADPGTMEPSPDAPSPETASPEGEGPGERSMLWQVAMGLVLFFLGGGVHYAIARARGGSGASARETAPSAPNPIPDGTDAAVPEPTSRRQLDPRNRVGAGRLLSQDGAGGATYSSQSPPPDGTPPEERSPASPAGDTGLRKPASPPVSPYENAVHRYADELARQLLVTEAAESLLGDLALYVRDRFDSFAGNRVVVGALADDLMGELSLARSNAPTAAAVRRPIEDLALALRRHQRFLAAVGADRSGTSEQGLPHDHAELDGPPLWTTASPP